MYIKQVVIEGFKSYREQVATETFSPKLTVLEGAGHQVLSAFVEIVFDNSDNRIPVDKEEVRLRRTIGVKKDEYFLDGKHITKTEVMNLLESAGFSRSNPYYVVQQGKIASLTLMKDSERLDLLKEIGGTRVYEERRRESLKIMQETGKYSLNSFLVLFVFIFVSIQEEQIIQVVQYLDDKLRELDEEKEELKKYQQLDRQRKSLEYTIYDKELHHAKQMLMDIEENRNKVSETSATMYNKVLDAHEKCKELDKLLKDLTKEAQILSREKEAIEKQRTEAIKKRAKLELDDKDFHDKIKANIKAKEDAVAQLELLEQEIEGSYAELTRIKQLYDNQVREEENLTRGIMEREKQLSILYQKQGRATQFASKAARDQWLKKEIRDYEQVLTSNLVQEKKLRDEIEQLKKDIREQDAYIKNRKDEAAELESLISGYRQGYSQYKAERDKLHDERKVLWARENELSAEIERLKSEVVKAEKSLDHATPGDIRRGLNSVKRICKEINLHEGVFGPIFELLDCDEKFFTAVEVTAGNSLFHVVVETDEISTKIIRHLNAQKGGRVTFIPLNRVTAPRVTYPQSSDVIPLLKKLQFSDKYASAFAQVFAKTVICRDLDVATRVARTDGLDCITLEGDQVNKKGGMTGGFYDYRRSKLKFMSTIKQNMKSIKIKEEELEEVRKKLQDILIRLLLLVSSEISSIFLILLIIYLLARKLLTCGYRKHPLEILIDQKINELVAEQQKNDAKLAHEKSLLEQLRQDAMNSEKQKQSISKSLEKKEKLLSSVLTQIDQNRANIAMKQDEMGTELVDHLTPEEKEISFSAESGNN
ncbi:UNVERIFIED_CONTAM: Structural maintenance of chromosomes protein 3 [Sesamum radiatum]|uniref:Structural maintenance of chromosomes protein 3 n=1 Tax=Sesamum radiatum TaxID=300843 RepID=A0AAW2W6P2_SESRA